MADLLAAWTIERPCPIGNSSYVVVWPRFEDRKRVSHRICLLSVVLAFVSGCSAVQQTYGIPATDLSWIRFDMAQSYIEERLGQPDETRSLEVEYEFDRGYVPPARDKPLMWPYASARVVLRSHTRHELPPNRLVASRPGHRRRCQRLLVLQRPRRRERERLVPTPG